MSNPNKKKGTAAETKVVNYLATFGIEAERRALSGNADKGDIKANYKGNELTLEVKTGKQTENPSRTQIEEWLRQTNVEAANAQCSGALVVVRYRRAIKDAEVYIPGVYGSTFMYLDEFAKEGIELM